MTTRIFPLSLLAVLVAIPATSCNRQPPVKAPGKPLETDVISEATLFAWMDTGDKGEYLIAIRSSKVENPSNEWMHDELVATCTVRSGNETESWKIENVSEQLPTRFNIKAIAGERHILMTIDLPPGWREKTLVEAKLTTTIDGQRNENLASSDVWFSVGRVTR